jgi:hypothetical protein
LNFLDKISPTCGETKVESCKNAFSGDQQLTTKTPIDVAHRLMTSVFLKRIRQREQALGIRKTFKDVKITSSEESRIEKSPNKAD